MNYIDIGSSPTGRNNRDYCLIFIEQLKRQFQKEFGRAANVSFRIKTNKELDDNYNVVSLYTVKIYYSAQDLELETEAIWFEDHAAVEWDKESLEKINSGLDNP